MALRSLDNALPIERPKKIAKVVVAAATIPTDVPSNPPTNNENKNEAPPKTAESIEYIASGDLKPVPNAEVKIKNLLEELNSKDWIQVCEALNDARRIALHHSSLLLPILENLMLVMVKAMKNPRSALIKTSILASADIFTSFGHLALSEGAAFDQLLLQLLLKASQDKKFVCEEAEKALETMAVSMSPVPLLTKLRASVNHTNPRVRAKAAVAISKCVSKMDIDNMKEFGLAKLLQVAAELLNDRLPEAREAARGMINSIHRGFTMDADERKDEEVEGASTAELWQDFCSANLSPISVLAVAKIVSQ